MPQQTELEESVRAGIFSSLPDADHVVQKLQAAGFGRDQITVICSDETKERYFREFEHQQPAGTHAAEATAAGASIGAVAGGLTAIAVGAASGAVPLILAGAAGLAGGSALGGFVGAMLTRGTEKELSNFYDQAVRKGDVVVAVEDHGPQAASQLARAAEIFRRAGTAAIPLPEG
ncbi:MAG: hypothetical protein ACT4QC_01260 [Planctomycetaceae bacterium]